MGNAHRARGEHPLGEMSLGEGEDSTFAYKWGLWAWPLARHLWQPGPCPPDITTLVPAQHREPP